MKRSVSGVLGGLAALGLSGCGGSAVLIRHDAGGGMLGLEGDREQAMADARRQMSEACEGAYTIVSERNAFAGTYHGRTVSEYQLQYRCGTEQDPPRREREP
jgi:hypothetical protein